MGSAAEYYEFWNDPRWMGGDLEFPEDTGQDRLEPALRINKMQHTIDQFEGKYPGSFWWTPEFVEKHPAVALTMQAVNDTFIFSDQALQYLTAVVEFESGLAVTRDGSPLEVQTAQLGSKAILQGDCSEFDTLQSILTDGDRLELAALLNGNPRVRVLPKKD